MATKNTEKNTVSVVVPREPGGDSMLFLALNGKTYNIPRGKRVELPAEVADVYYRSIEAEDYARKYSDEQNAAMNEIVGAP